jgi:hypothetical protein
MISKVLIFLTYLILQVYSYEISCGNNHKAYVWNCQTLLDNWRLDDNKFYDPREYSCLWSGITKGGTIGCKLLENDSCTLVISYSISQDGYSSAGYTGSELKKYVQDSINKCTSNNEVSSHMRYPDAGRSGILCLCNHGSASSCY